MEGLQELRSKKFQELLTEIGREIKSHDVEILKNQGKLKERLPRSVLDGIDSQGKNSGSEFLKTLQEQGLVGDDNLELLKELLQNIQRQDLSEKLSQFEKKIKELGTKFSATRGLDFSTGLKETSTTGRGDVGGASLGSPTIKEPSTGSPLIEERIAAPVDVDRAFFEPLASDSKILDSKYVKIDAEEAFQDLSSFGVLLQIPPNAVTRRTKILCVKLLPELCSPAEEGETQVSHCVRIYSLPVAQLQEPIIVTLLHSGPSKKEGYETIVKAWKENQWKQIQELQQETPRAREHFKSGFIEVEISEWTALAVVTRPITDNFEVTPKGCVVRSSVCDDVTVEFPEGAVNKTYMGSMKMLLMPDYIEILDGIDAYPCPILLIDGLEGVGFNIPVKIRLPHPYPAGYPTGNVRVLTMEDPHEWKDITDEVHCIENESFIEINVSHFSGLWVWVKGVPSSVVTQLSKYLFQVPQHVCFAVFKKEELCSDTSLTMTLLCAPNNEQFNIETDMKKLSYTQIACNSADKEMRPGDKAYTKVEGCYENKLKQDIFLKFIENGVCRKDLHLLRKTSEEEKAESSSRDLVLSLLEKKDGDDKHNLCTFYIEEMKIFPKQTATESSPEVEIVGQESGPAGYSGTQGLETVPYAAQGHELSLPEGSDAAKTEFENLVQELHLYRTSMEDPPPELVKKCRNVCQLFAGRQRKQWIEEFRKLLPCGTTGPLEDQNKRYEQLDAKKKQDLTRALCGPDVLKRLLDAFGKLKNLDFYEKRNNPVEFLLEEEIKKRAITIGELYDVLVKCEVNALADEYL